MYLEEAPTLVLKKKGRPKKASSIKADTSNIERHIKPLLGDMLIRDVTLDDIDDFQQAVADGKTAQVIPPEKNGTTPNEARPVSRVIAARPPSNRPTSPRNLLTI